MGVYAADRRMPEYNVEATCDKAALDPRNKDGYREVYLGCIEGEQKAYNSLKSLWPHIENRVVDYCNGAYGDLGTSRNLRIELYQVYLPCIQYIGPGYFEGKQQREQVRKDFQLQR